MVIVWQNESFISFFYPEIPSNLYEKTWRILHEYLRRAKTVVIGQIGFKNGRLFHYDEKIDYAPIACSNCGITGLLTWLSDIRIPPRCVFVTHGEEKAATSFAKTLSESTGWKTGALNIKIRWSSFET
jgi:hypothetical protein